MNRTIFGGALISVLFLLLGTFLFPNSLVMGMASISAPYTIFRVVVVFALLAVLFTSPPRKLALRFLMGGVGLALLSVGISLSLGDGMHVLDTLVFLEVGFAFGLEALELNEDELNERILRLQHPEYYLEDGPTLGSLVVKRWQNLRYRATKWPDWQPV